MRLRASRDSLVTVVLVALILRCGLSILRVDQLMADTFRDHWNFGFEAGRIARSIALSQGFSNPLHAQSGPTAWMGPVYPYILGLVFKMFGIYTRGSALAILGLNSLFSALTCIPIYWIARRGFGAAVAIAAAWAWALYPSAIFASAYYIWETCLSALLIAALLESAFRIKSSSNVLAWALFGVLGGVAALNSPVALTVFIPVLAWTWFRKSVPAARLAVRNAVAILALCLTLAPWLIRNENVFHRFIPIRDNFGLELWVGNNGDTSHWFPYWKVHPSVNEGELAQFNQLGESAYMRHKMDEAMEFIARNPGEFALLTLRRMVYEWTGYWSLDRTYLSREWKDPIWIVCLTFGTLLMLRGLKLAFRNNREVAILLAAVLLFQPLVYYVTHFMFWYRDMIDPEVLILAVYGFLA